VIVGGPEEVIKEKIKRARGKDEKVVKVVGEMRKVGVRNLKSNE